MKTCYIISHALALHCIAGAPKYYLDYVGVI